LISAYFSHDQRSELIFYAGGGTFGVVMEATMLADPQLKLQVTVITWKNTDKAQSTPYTREMFKILIDNALKVCSHSSLSRFIARLTRISTSGLTRAMAVWFGRKPSSTSHQN
jgi:hypothetical protein